MCEYFENYLKWYTETVGPFMLEFAKHAANCKECQDTILNMKDEMALSFITTPDEEIREKLQKYNRDSPGA